MYSSKEVNALCAALFIILHISQTTHMPAKLRSAYSILLTLALLATYCPEPALLPRLTWFKCGQHHTRHLNLKLVHILLSIFFSEHCLFSSFLYLINVFCYSRKCKRDSSLEIIPLRQSSMKWGRVKCLDWTIFHKLLLIKLCFPQSCACMLILHLILGPDIFWCVVRGCFIFEVLFRCSHPRSEYLIPASC